MVKTPTSLGHSSMRPSLDVRVFDEHDCTRVRVVGEIDLATTPALRSTLRGNLNQPFNDIRLDLSGVTFIDSAGLAVILEARDRWIASGANFTIEKASPVVHRLTRLLQSVDSNRGEEMRHVG